MRAPDRQCPRGGIVECDRVHRQRLDLPREHVGREIALLDRACAAGPGDLARIGGLVIVGRRGEGDEDCRPPGRAPFGAATDDHQTANAREITRAGGARTIAQDDFTAEALARQIEAIASDPQALANAAERSLSVGRPNAARDLADLAERVGGGLSPILVGPALSPR
jgi:hypothetical protein